MTAPTVERWARDYVLARDLAHKLAPPPRPRAWAERPQPERVAAPGRPPELTVAARSPKPLGPRALEHPERRARLVHTFLHHELQAAELMAWAVLAFPETPRAFRVGLLGVMADELRHMALYASYLTGHGFRFGDFPVRDWFWERVPSCLTPAAFVATLGVGVEGANLDHTRRFAERFRAAGDDEGARLQETVGREEIPHVRFARRWLARFAGKDDFDAWRAELPPPLSPLLMRGVPMDRPARLRAGYTEDFLDRLAAYDAGEDAPRR